MPSVLQKACDWVDEAVASRADGSIAGWLTAKMLWVGVVIAFVFVVEGVLLYALDRREGEQRLAAISSAIGPEVALALWNDDGVALSKTLSRHVDTYSLLGASARGGKTGVSASAVPLQSEPSITARVVRALLANSLTTRSYSTPLTHEGRPVGHLELSLDNTDFIALLALMFVSTVAAFALLARVATSAARRLRDALQAPTLAMAQLSEQVTVSGNLEYRITTTAAGNRFGFEDTVNQFLEVLSSREKEYQAISSNLRNELASRARDIAAQAKQLQTLAYTSTETGLPNRTALVERVRGMCAEFPEQQRSVGLFMCHVSRVRHINEALGFDAGAAMVRFAGQRFEESSPQFSELFHLGGPDFAVLVEGPSSLMTEVVDRLLFVEESPFKFNGTALHLNLRVGYALFPDDAASADELTRFAPIALSASLNNRGPVPSVRFSPEFLLTTMSKETLEDAIRFAVEHEQIEPYFQPRVDALTGRVSGFEAFVRWNSPVLKGHDTTELLKIAERSMLITQLDERMLRRVAAWAGSLARDGIRMPVAVNVSARTLHQADYVHKLRMTLQEFNADPAQVELELTETVLIEGSPIVAANLRKLVALGVQILLDDFGSGYSSLRYLLALPISIVKIDKAFVQGLPNDESSRLIIESTLDLCRRLGKRTVAEGVESRTQLEHLRALGCNEVQGFYLMRPKSAAQTREAIIEQFDRATGAMHIPLAAASAPGPQKGGNPPAPPGRPAGPNSR